MASEAVWRLWGYKCPPNATTARIFTDQNVINYRIDPLVRHWKCYHLGLKCSYTAGHLENFPLVTHLAIELLLGPVHSLRGPYQVTKEKLGSNYFRPLYALDPLPYPIVPPLDNITLGLGRLLTPPPS